MCCGRRRPSSAAVELDQPMCRATTSHRVPSPAGTCSTRQAMAWTRRPRAVGPENLGGGFRAAVRHRLQPHPAQHRGALVAGRRAAQRRHRLDQTGRQQGPQLGHGTAAVDDFQHSAQCGVGEHRRLAHRCGRDRRRYGGRGLRLPAVRPVRPARGAARQRRGGACRAALSGALRRWFVLDDGNDGKAVGGRLIRNRTIDQQGTLRLTRNECVRKR